ncbi:phospho-sugar mutase [Aliarcobacter trophiarum LMG 25534]|uniref:Phospho-sugar mutase n=1 Tax=Aliarcobacter trophiarum LMG 25534 TaxID=1032241 RepID=A0AAD0VME8_9BACT|nr:phosphomannomutase/phosphoglucomutase [Aliarcobacter trophiarum]AXK49353.1 phosphomannomutase / phosphoglucomutase [Aliarcobacter trophiarum LMG 25534]RXI27699.1 phospho-sugar mutase [Aliarcobacter trophiarum]RXJ90081.1 phospho-sugar mutase [Aliarcobacter trophiarum LMG 25534]
MSASIFREYDIRGIYQKELNEDIVKKIGFYLAKSLLKRVPNAVYMAVGYDARLHSPTLKNWLSSGINKAGLKVLDMGLVPTPANYFTNFNEIDGYRCDGSIMITGSHNPPEYNGFKITLDKDPFFGDEIYALGDEILKSGLKIEDNETAIKINSKDRYIDYIVENFKHLRLENKKFVFDCGNGVAGVVLREILDRLNIKHKILFEEPDGNFPNHHPDPSDEHTLEDIKKELNSGEFDFGFAYDGDADRIALLSRKYNFKGDILAIFFSKHIENPTVIGEVKCSQVMYDIINSYGKAIMYKTGHSNLKVKIKETNASFAAEVSGHLFFNDRYFGYDDAIYATFRALELLDQGFDFDKEFESLPQVYSTPEINITVTEETKFKLIEDLKGALKNPPADFPKIKDIITVDGVRVIFDKGWGLVRASNTTPKLVTRFEADTKDNAKLYEDALINLFNTLKGR